MRHFLIQSSFIFTLGCLWIPINSNAKPKNWITEDLSYWNVPAGNQKHNWYRVNKGILELRSDPERKHSVLRTKKIFQNFTCSFDFLFVDGNIDSGIELRNNDQIQIGISGSLKRDMTGSPYIPGKGYPKHATGVGRLLKLRDWNQMSIRCVGPSYQVFIQGEVVVEYESPRAIKEGPIGVQLHGNRDMQIDFRNFFISDL